MYIESRMMKFMNGTSITHIIFNVHSLLSNHELCTYNLKFYVAKERNKIKREQIKERY